MNRIEDALIERALQHPAFGHYRPWIEDVRKERPYQLDDKLEQLFHEKSVTGRGAWNRLFDETIAALKFKIGGEELSLEPALNVLTDPSEEKRHHAADEISRVLRSDLRTFTLVTNVLAKDKEISDRWRGFKDIADDRHLSNRVEPELVEALVSAVRASFPRLSHRYYALKAKWFGKKQLEYWDRNAPLPKVETRTIGWNEARDTVLSAYGAFSPQMASVAKRFFDDRWIDAPARPGKSPAPSRIPPCPRRIPTCW